MSNKSLLVLFIVITACITEICCKTGKYGKYDEEDSNNLNQSTKVKSKGAGLSAWGLIILIVCAILFGVGVYYVVIFYPLLCKKERKYDRIELTTV